MYREQWLTRLARRIEVIFTEAGYEIPPYRISCGWPSKNPLAESGLRLGECHGPRSSRDSVFEIFITPLLGSRNSLEIAGVVAHELAHVVAGIRAKHGPKFTRICKKVGLNKGKPTSASPGVDLLHRLRSMLKGLPKYPSEGMCPARKKERVRISKNSLFCTKCPARIRMSYGMERRHGKPRCSCGGEFRRS